LPVDSDFISAEIELINSLGEVKKVEFKELNFDSGVKYYEINTSDVLGGVYLIKATIGYSVLTEKLIVNY
jgi:hypothetical protein